MRDESVPFTVRLADVSPVDARTDAAQRKIVWQAAAETLASSPPVIRPWSTRSDAYIVEIDATDVLEYVSAVARFETDQELVEARWAQRATLGLHPLTCQLKLRLTPLDIGKGPDLKLYAVGKFLQQLFLGLNLAVPGSLTLYAAQYPDITDPVPEPPQHSADILEFACNHALERGWPPVGCLSFPTVWKWLSDRLPCELDLAEAPHQKALFTLLRATSPHTDEAATILLIAQALEALFVEGREGIGSMLRQRLELVLGSPTTHKNWFQRFYERRSKIAHGITPVLRPGRLFDEDDSSPGGYMDDFFVPIDEAIAVLLAVLQDLVKSGAMEYRFTQHVQRLGGQGPKSNGCL